MLSVKKQQLQIIKLEKNGKENKQGETRNLKPNQTSSLRLECRLASKHTR